MLKYGRQITLGIMTAAVGALALGACASGTADSSSARDGQVTLEFAKWWEPELPNGALRSLMDKFEAQNPGIKVKLLSGPYASTKEQIVAGAAAGTMSDVVGLDGAWVHDFATQGSISDLSAMMTEYSYDDSELASQIRVDGKTYMIPVTNFVYPMFVNNDLLKAAGIDKAPTNRSEFMQAAQKIAATSAEVSGWVMPLSLEAPNGIQNDVMSWVWASGGSMLSADGKPNLTNDDVKSAVAYIKELWDQGVISSGSFTMKEQDKVEDFTNGRVGMMIDSLAHITMIQESNPNLDFQLAALPAKDDYSGKRGMPYASWGIGISSNTEHPAEAWKLVKFLLSSETNAELCDYAKAFPGNVKAVPQFVNDNEMFKKAFDIWNSGEPANEFTGLPVAEKLMREFDEQFQMYLSGDIDIDTMLSTVQKSWEQEF